MNVERRKFGTLILSALAMVTAALLLGAVAYGDLQDYDGLKGRSYHAEMHEKGKCRTCHGVAEPDGYPEDQRCLRCHDVEELAEATQPETEEDRWQNPHNNLHYGMDVPCVECHGEHSNKAPLCANCHNFDYPNHQF